MAITPIHDPLPISTLASLNLASPLSNAEAAETDFFSVQIPTSILAHVNDEIHITATGQVSGEDAILRVWIGQFSSGQWATLVQECYVGSNMSVPSGTWALDLIVTAYDSNNQKCHGVLMIYPASDSTLPPFAMAFTANNPGHYINAAGLTVLPIRITGDGSSAGAMEISAARVEYRAR